MTFLPDTATMLSYSLACFILFITPGPDMSFFLAKTMQGGRSAGIAAMSGASFGNLVHSMAAAFGLSALIAASATAFAVVRIVGALYLLWMAYDAIRHGSALNIERGDRKDISVKRTFLQGLGVNITNPKIILFYLTFLPQFVAANDPHAQSKLLFLGIYFVIFALPLAVGLILVAERFIETMRRNPKLMRAIDFSFAGIFTLFAVQVLRTQGR
ncbi:MAG: LysE family translocator [Beijerinckiaceae bacterium]|jgi:threonine/homoserine/homoserine lactone efflux protein|nr:LysE family translocator [Beijerinckiaceae bacterium]